MCKIFLFLFLFCENFERFCSKIVEGEIKSNEKWVFVTRFCFLSDSGQLKYEFTFSKHIAPIYLLFYYDEPEQWPAVYLDKVPCEKAISAPYINPEYFQKLVLKGKDDISIDSAGCSTVEEAIVCASERFFKAHRERWWFVAIARCDVNTTQGLYVQYKLHMLNGDGSLSKELSADEFYILETSIGFLLGFVLLTIIAFKFSNDLRQRMLLHTTYKMFLVSLVLTVISLLVTCIAFGRFVDSGYEPKNLKYAGKGLMACAHIIFLIMLLLLGKGYNVTRGRLSQGSSIKIFSFSLVYIICYVILFLVNLNSDPGLVLYIYESAPGYGLITLRIIAWLYFTFAVFMTLKHYSEKKKFYYPLYVFYTIWFLIGPIFVLIAVFEIEKYHREKIVNGVELGISFLAYIYLLFLTRPSHSNKNFPYHVRTSQVGILEENNNQNYNKKAYDAENSTTLNAKNFTNLFDIVRSVYSTNDQTNGSIPTNNGSVS